MELTNKQIEVMECVALENPVITVLSGAKRAGKTFILTLIFLSKIAERKDEGVEYILGGATQASIRRNVLNDMERILGKELKIAKDGSVKIFGNKVYVLDGSKSDSWKKARGFTAYGALLNEGTSLNDMFVKECISRCSGSGATIYIDTNPENPTHFVKKDYIDKSGERLDNGRLNIKAFHFTLFDNNFLSPEYVESIVKSTPLGMFTDRDIYGKWVSAQGVIYSMYNPEKHLISKDELKNYNIVRYFCGVDWGFQHYGVINLCARTDDGKVLFIKEWAETGKHIDYWLKVAKQIKKEHGDIYFYADSARPEYVVAFQEAGLKCIKAKKSVLAGITEVATLMHNDNLLIVDEDVKLFKDEVYNYVWKEGTDEPVKAMDDSMDGLRYAIFSDAWYNDRDKFRVDEDNGDNDEEITTRRRANGNNRRRR